MSKTWGIARFYGMGSMEYLLESEDWLADSKLFDGAPLLLFETMEEADIAAKALLTGRNAHGVQFTVDSENRVLTWKSAKAKEIATTKPAALPRKAAKFTIFEDSMGYWCVPHDQEAAAISTPEHFRKVVHRTKIAACRQALEMALRDGATELHLHGMGATTGIKREAIAKGIKPFIYFASVTTKLASHVPSGKR